MSTCDANLYDIRRRKPSTSGKFVTITVCKIMLVTILFVNLC